jgi:hypothetical protein
VLRPREDGVEDLVRFAARPLQEAVDYLVDVRGVAGLRQVGNVVEFLDEGGAPRLRMEAPYVLGARGEVARGKVEVGCAHDEDERGPWGRAVVRPGVEECRVRVEWGGVEYPAVLDPVWSTTASLAQDRVAAGFGVMDSGRFLVAAGSSCLGGECDGLKSSEIYDPTTGTWAQGAPCARVHDNGASLAVPGLGVLFFGTDSKIYDNAIQVELYREGPGTWETLPPLTVGRRQGAPLLTADKKKALLIGGLNPVPDPSSDVPVGVVDVLDLATLTWLPSGSLLKARYLATVNELPDGKILVAGGSECSNCGPMADAELFDPVTLQSELLPDMKIPHFGHTSATLQVEGKTRVLIAGGGIEDCELYLPESKSWALTGSMNLGAVFAASTLLPDGSFLSVGGAVVPTFGPNLSAERYDPIDQVWKPAGSPKFPHAVPAFGLLAGGQFLVAGGAVNNVLVGTTSDKNVELFELQPLAAPCEGSGECASRFCADGVCCATACSGSCQACSAAKKGSGADGQCGPVAKDTDPDDECPTQDKSTCGTSGACNGQGACAKYPVNTPCGTATCVDGVSTGLLCNAQNQCQQQVASCLPFLCKDPTACATACESDAQCTPTAHCSEGLCVNDKGQGSACERNTECISGFCVDGVCCSEACAGTCQACKGSLKEGGGPDGLCGLALANSDPHDDCADEPLLGCDKNGFCDGKGSCALYDAGLECQAPLCVSDNQGGFREDSFACDGAGTCLAKPGVACGLFGCAQGKCLTSCSLDSECAASAYCNAGTCVPKKPLGETCAGPGQCAGGLCVDGVCCSSPCEGPCEVCNKEGAVGSCVPVDGLPRNGRPACPEPPEGRPCERRLCDGIVRESCAGFVGPDVACRVQSCAAGVVTNAAVCDGEGACPALLKTDCSGFACDGATCKTSCSSDADCEPRFQCDAGKGDCIPRTIAVCDGASTLLNPDGTTTSCAPYGCEGSACKNQCSSVLDCVLPNVCDDSSRTCIPSRPNPNEEAGCHLAPGPHRGAAGVLGLLALLGALRLRRARRPV